MNNKWIFFLIILSIAGCIGDGNDIILDDIDNSTPVNLNEQFNLKIDQAVIIESESLKVKFLEVTEDSRCPSDVTCIWAGRVGVLLNISIDNNNLGDIKLMNGADSQKLDIKDINGYSIRLVKVDPYPISTKEIKPSDYIISLIISKSIG